MAVSVKEIARYIELNKLISDLVFRKNILGLDCQNELIAVEENKKNLQNKINDSQISIIIPRENELTKIEIELSKFSNDEIKKALKEKTGEIYKILVLRATFLKNVIHNRFEIAKLAILISKLETEEKTKIIESIKNGNEVQLEKDTLLDKIGFRLGLTKNETVIEKSYIFSERRVWLDLEKSELFEKTATNLESIIAKIQIQNAQKQIKQFDTKEEEDFANLQKEYLELLKQKDQILNSLESEELI